MTGYAARDVASQCCIRSWELRSVNGRGLDMRLRLPDRLGRLEIPLREKLNADARAAQRDHARRYAELARTWARMLQIQTE